MLTSYLCSFLQRGRSLELVSLKKWIPCLDSGHFSWDHILIGESMDLDSLWFSCITCLYISRWKLMYGMHFDFSRRMYEEFKMLAVEDAAAGYRYDVETLFNLFSESQLCFPLFFFVWCVYILMTATLINSMQGKFLMLLNGNVLIQWPCDFLFC